jgi:heterodisulfide reductase subunit C
MDRVDAGTWLWYLHVFAAFIGLAYLPFGKMFHVMATPLSLMANAVGNPDTSTPANRVTRQLMELDACTHCGTCSQHCSAGMIYEAIGNDYILPSEKLGLLRDLTAGKRLSAGQMQAIQEGVYLCTNCDRCTVRCPSGIRLKELWYAVREYLLQGGPALASALTPYSFARGLVIQDRLAAEDYALPIERARAAVAGQFSERMDPAREVSLNAESSQIPPQLLAQKTFSHCFGCQSCTVVCPVVGNYKDCEQVLGLLPHQIMYCLGLGLTEMASGAKMIWDCLTCYKCQENCPQQVDVCDLLFCLKNLAAARLI